MKHVNNGNCPACDIIFNRYPGFYPPLRDWFAKFQENNPEAHISDAGRGRQDQEAYFRKHVSNAHYGESAHNYNAAIDIFEMRPSDPDIYEKVWFDTVLQPALEEWTEWYGAVGSPYFEVPHVQVKAWKTLAARGVIKLVE